MSPGQLELLAAFTKFYGDLPWSEDHRPPLRYCYGHGYFCHGGDAIRAFPASCGIFNPNESWRSGAGSRPRSCSIPWSCLVPGSAEDPRCIEPYPDRLRSLLRGDETASFRLQEQKLQDVDGALFETLEAGDILFIDSSHVSKIGSDVNRLIFEILPILKPAVLVHFHDIFYPFEYLKDWIMEGRAWNEAYLVRAFLQFNYVYRIVFFNSYLHRIHREAISAGLPLTARNPGGSLWLQKAHD